MKQNTEEIFQNECINLLNEKGVNFKELENRFVAICETACNVKEAKNLMLNKIDEAEEINASLLKAINLVEKKNRQKQVIDTQGVKKQVFNMFSKEYKRTYDNALNNFRERNNYQI